MTKGSLRPVGVPGAVALVVVITLATSGGLPVGSAQMPNNPAEKAGPAPRTSWGTPDLTGIWSARYDTPLQRLPEYKDKQFLTDEEVAALDKQRATFLASEFDVRHERGSARDVSGAYSANIFMSFKPTGKRTSLITDPADGRIPPSTPEAKKRREEMHAFVLELLQATEICRDKLIGCEGGRYGPPSPRYHDVPPFYITTGTHGAGLISRADNPEDRTLAERCMAGGLPDLGGYPQYVLSKDALSIYYDTGQGQGWQRVIPITNRPHVAASVRLWMGDSRAKWEGETLVVDVTNFSPKTDYLGSRENLHLVERYTRKDANTLELVVRIEDQTTWTKPWTVTQELTRQPDKANRHYKEPRCHEGNYGMAALLQGARTEERAYAQGKGPNPATICSAGCGDEFSPFSR